MGSGRKDKAKLVSPASLQPRPDAAAPCIDVAARLPADVLVLAIDTLKEAAAYFSRLNCKERLRDVHYLQAQLHRSLGQSSQCNKSAMLFRLLDQELQSPAPASMRL